MNTADALDKTANAADGMREYTENDCLWLRLAGEKLPVALYGTGNGADKILDACIKYGIKISGVFAGDGFVRNREFRGFKVESLEDIEKRLSDFIILLCFGTTRADVTEQIREAARRHKMYIPDVPLYGGELFDYGFILRSREKLAAARSLLSDAESKAVFDDMISFRLGGEGKYLSRTESAEKSLEVLIAPYVKKGGLCIDCGAFTGDSASAAVSTLSPKCLIAAEPDSRSFRKLSEYAGSEGRCRVVPVNAAVGDTLGQTVFLSGSGRSSGKATNARRAKEISVKTVTVDSLCDGENNAPVFIKYDVEGDEAAAIRGSERTIKSFRPALAVSVYHRSADIFEIPLYLHRLCPSYSFYLRRVPCIPAWDITLFAVDTGRTAENE